MSDGPCYPQVRPCPTCPWWLENPTDGSRIPRFKLAKMLALRDTVGPGDAIRNVMACHASPEGGDWPCVGYVARHGYSNIALRIAAAQGRIDLPAIIDGCADLPLYDTFDDMLAAYLADLGPGDTDPCTETCTATDAGAAPTETTT